MQNCVYLSQLMQGQFTVKLLIENASESNKLLFNSMRYIYVYITHLIWFHYLQWNTTSKHVYKLLNRFSAANYNYMHIISSRDLSECSAGLREFKRTFLFKQASKDGDA